MCSILYNSQLGDIRESSLFEIQIKTYRGIVKGQYMGVYDYTVDHSEPKSAESETGSAAVSNLSLEALDHSGAPGERLQLLDHIRIQLHIRVARSIWWTKTLNKNT